MSPKSENIKLLDPLFTCPHQFRMTFPWCTECLCTNWPLLTIIIRMTNQDMTWQCTLGFDMSSTLRVTIVTLSDNLWLFYASVHWRVNMRNVSNNRYIHNNIIGQNRKSIRYFAINNCFLLLLVEWRIKMGKISLSYFLLFITLQPSSVTHWET